MKRAKQWLFITLTVMLAIVVMSIVKVGLPTGEREPTVEQKYLEVVAGTATKIESIALKVVNLYSDYASGNTTAETVLIMSADYAKQYGGRLALFSLYDAPPGYETLREAVIENITSRQKQLEAMSEYIKTGDSSYTSLVESYEASIAQSGALIMNEWDRLAIAKK